MKGVTQQTRPGNNVLSELHFNTLYIFQYKYHFNLKHTNLTIICTLFCIGGCCLD